MLKRNLTLAIRVFRKNPLSSLITVGGLSLGIGCFLLLYIYVYNEYQTDRIHANYDHLYRVGMDYYVDDEPRFSIPPPAGLFYDLGNIPKLISGSRAFSPNDVLVEYDELRFLEDGIVMVDSTWLDLFDFEYQNNNFDLFKGLPKVIISSSAAQQIFGNTDPINKEITIDGHIYLVENVVVTSGYNSSMNINFILPFQARANNGTDINSYQGGHTPYFVVSQELTIDELQKSLQKLIDKNTDEAFDVRIKLSSLEDAYFEGMSGLKFKNGSLRGNKKYYIIFSVVGILILVMAIINYINLVTARASMRSKEVGIKKTIGAQKMGLWTQFMTESFLVTCLSGVLAIGLAELALPWVNSILVRPIVSGFLITWQFASVYILAMIVISVLAGVYPALVLTSYKPLGAINKVKQKGSSWLRNALVTIQFVVTSVLIFGALVIYNQVSFLSSIDLGFEKEHIISIKASDRIRNHISVVKNDLSKIQNIKAVSVGNLPGIGWMYNANINNQNINVAIQQVDEDFIEMAGIELLEGRFLSRQDYGTSNTVINKTMRDLLFGDSTTVFGKQGETERVIIGVVEDFQFSSVKNDLMPLEIKSGEEKFRDVLIRVNDNADHKKIIDELKDVIMKHDPDSVFEYSFLDEDYDNQFKAEQLFLTLLRGFTLLSIFIGGLGLFGLSQFNFIKNLKNIGIRKVLGAPHSSLIMDMIKTVSGPIVLGLMIALPIGFNLMSDWLNSYSNRVEITWLVFIVTVGLVALITFITIIYQLILTVTLNPANTLKED